MIAVIQTGGKQYIVKEGDVVKIEKLDAKIGDKVAFETLMSAEGDSVTLGKPSLGQKVSGEVVEQGRDAKVEVVKYKPKSRYTRRTGHRQAFTKVKIAKIG